MDMLYITKEMTKDFEENCLWNPRPDNLINTIEAVSDALAMAGYSVEIRKAYLEQELLECPNCSEKGAYIAKDNPSKLICNLCGTVLEIETPNTHQQPEKER